MMRKKRSKSDILNNFIIVILTIALITFIILYFYNESDIDSDINNEEGEDEEETNAETCGVCEEKNDAGICVVSAIDTSCGDDNFCDGSGNCVEYQWYRTGEEYVLQSGDWCEWGVNNFQCVPSTENNYGWSDKYVGTPYWTTSLWTSDVKCRPWVSNDAYVGETIYKYQCQKA